MTQIPNAFSGTLTLQGDQPFTAQVVGYDYPGAVTVTASPTPSMSTTASRTPTSTVAMTATPSATPTRTPTTPATVTKSPSPTSTVAMTATPSATGTPTVVDSPTNTALPSVTLTPNLVQISAVVVPTQVVAIASPPAVVQYTISLTQQASGRERVSDVTDNLPTGFIYLAGSTTMTMNGTQFSVADPTVTGATLDWGPAFWQGIATRNKRLASGQTLNITFNVDTSANPGVYLNDAVVTYVGQTVMTSQTGLTAPVRVVTAAPTATLTPTATPTVRRTATMTATTTPVATSSATARPTTTATPTATPSPVRGGPKFVQSALGYTGSTVNSESATFSGTVASGDLIVVAISSYNYGNNAVVQSVGDSQGNLYTQAVVDPSPATNANEPLSIWYAANVVGGTPLTVTANVTTPSALSVAIHEYSGAFKTGVVDQVVHANGTGSVASSGLTASTTNANDLLFGASNFSDISIVSGTAGAGYTLRQGQSNNICCNSLFTEDLVVNATGQYGVTISYANSVNYRAAIVAFR
jgi:hypothetical protein